MSDTPEPATNDIAQVRDLIRRTHPDTVPELITGYSVADLLAST